MKPQAAPMARTGPGAVEAPRRPVQALRIIHPFPTLLNVAATAGLAFVAADGAPDASRLVRMMLLMLFAQSAIGTTNDLFDRELDARTKPWKPLVAGVIRPEMATALLIALVAATAILGITLGVASFALAMLGLSCGLAYDVRLKRSMFSAVPFMVAIPTLPIWVWVTLGEWENSLLWLAPLGALIGLALHLANTLPDLREDARFGVRGLAHRLGATRSAAIGWSSFALALLISVALVPLLDYELAVYAPAAGSGAICLAGAIAIYAVRRDDFALQIGFGGIGIASVVIAVGWLAAVT
ncbi:MAG: UbiA family prenyltransferase [Dehalococcoidia bacterium]